MIQQIQGQHPIESLTRGRLGLGRYGGGLQVDLENRLVAGIDQGREVIAQLTRDRHRDFCLPSQRESLGLHLRADDQPIQSAVHRLPIRRGQLQHQFGCTRQRAAP